MKRIILPTLAAVLVVAAITGVFVLRSHPSSAKPAAASWTMYQDPLGLFTINYPVGWKAVGSVSTGGQVITATYTIHFANISEGVDITEIDNPNMTIHIGATKFANANTEDFFCDGTNLPFYTSGSLPENGVSLPGSRFNTTNANFTISSGPPQTDIVDTGPRGAPVAVPASELPTYNSILATFKPLAPKGSSW